MIEKLKKFLLKQPDVSGNNESNNHSLYFYLPNYELIRVSNHLGFENKNIVLNIIFPYNNQEKFIVICNNRCLIIENYSKLKDFIKNFLLIHSISAVSAKVLTDEIKEEVNNHCKELINKVDNYIEARTQLGEAEPLSAFEKETVALLRDVHPSYYPSILKTIRIMTISKKSKNFQKLIN